MLSQVRANNDSVRFDSEFFLKEYFGLLEFLSSKKHEKLGDISKWITQGPNPTFCEPDEFSIPCLTGRNINKGRVNYINPDFVNTFEYDALNKFQLKRGDTLVTLKGKGSIGKIGYVTEEKPAIFSRDIGIIRSSEKISAAYLNAYILSKYGQKLIARGETGGTGQSTLTTSYLKSILVPRLENEETIGDLIIESEVELRKSHEKYSQAETLLLETLGLADFKPSAKNTNIKSFQESFGSSCRLDAEFYQPKFDEIETLIKSKGEYCKRVGEFQNYNARGLQPEYFANGPLDVINSKHILEDHLDYENFEKTSAEFWDLQAKAQVYKGDILVYTTGANIGRTNIYQSGKKALASNHVNILRIKDEDPYYVAFVMNSLIGRMQTDKLSAGSAQAELYPRDIAQFLIPFVDKNTQLTIREKIISSLALKKKSTALLETAKRAVEIAIEQDEAAGMAYIEAAQA